jgi:hypothetical protein
MLSRTGHTNDCSKSLRVLAIAAEEKWQFPCRLVEAYNALIERGFLYRPPALWVAADAARKAELSEGPVERAGTHAAACVPPQSSSKEHDDMREVGPAHHGADQEGSFMGNIDTVVFHRLPDVKIDVRGRRLPHACGEARVVGAEGCEMNMHPVVFEAPRKEPAPHD